MQSIPKQKELKKVQTISQSYYSRKDIQQAIYNFCKNREVVPNYNNEFFGKRPDYLDYPSDVFNMAKSGATSFHCSEELWQNPLEISIDMTPEQYNQIKIGWDFLIDIDSKYIDYSKSAAKLIIKALEYHGVKNIGIKFSGSKGFHILIPFKAFPKQLGEQETKDMFPEWPRLIAQYISEIIQDKLTQEILKLSSRQDLESKGKKIFEVKCKICENDAIIQKISKYLCKNCKAQMQSTKSVKKTLRCPSCNYDMQKTGEGEIYVCNECKINSQKNPSQFKKRISAKSLIDTIDIVLVAPRHLFRAPYSLHEKSALSSIVLEKDEIENFQPSDADPLKVKIKNFNPNCEEGEARELLLQAIDWAKRKNIKITKFTGKSIDLKGLTIKEDMFPHCIQKILQGIKQDGRKRALSLLLSFFSSLEMPQEYIEEQIEKWNKKNYKPLKEGYLRSQVYWYVKNPRMPPNYDKPIYRELGILGPNEGSDVKNPINHTIKQAFRAKGKPAKKQNEK